MAYSFIFDGYNQYFSISTTGKPGAIQEYTSQIPSPTRAAISPERQGTAILRFADMFVIGV